MKNILILTDFSDTAKSAAQYAVHFANHVKAKKIILYNAYSLPLSTEMTWALIESNDLKKISEDGLEKCKTLLQPFCEKGLEIETISDFGFIGQRINDIAREVSADLIVMGITGGGKLEHMLLGSNTITVLHHTHVPVLVVPPKVEWKNISKIAWACDYDHIRETTPMSVIQQIVQLTGSQLYVIHNHSDNEKFNPQIIQGDAHINEEFKNIKPEFVLLEGKDLSEAVNKYVDDRSIDWLIVIPKKHSWLESIFSKGHTKELVFHTRVPMLCCSK